jgi:dimethylargininase
MKYTKAIVRRPGRNFSEGITTAGLGKPDYLNALEQHEAYCNTLKECGLELIVLEADEGYPDGCFVEDTAIVTKEVAIITRPGAAGRLGEELAISEVLSEYRLIERIVEPGTLDGGDVMRVEDHFYIGLSERTNSEGAGQLARVLAKHGYTASMVPVASGLHLKSGIAYLGQGNLISSGAFSLPSGSNVIITEKEESYSANCLRVNDTLLIPEGFPLSKMKIIGLGYKIIELDKSEFRKMDGGLTCLSLLF